MSKKIVFCAIALAGMGLPSEASARSGCIQSSGYMYFTYACIREDAASVENLCQKRTDEKEIYFKIFSDVFFVEDGGIRQKYQQFGQVIRDEFGLTGSGQPSACFDSRDAAIADRAKFVRVSENSPSNIMRWVSM